MTRTAMTWERAFARLELSPEASASDLKRAYRRAVAAFPPDRAPDAFEEIRAAYELLSDPAGEYGRLHRLPPQTAPLRIRRPEPVDVSRELPLAVLRAYVAGLDLDALLETADVE